MKSLVTVTGLMGLIGVLCLLCGCGGDGGDGNGGDGNGGDGNGGAAGRCGFSACGGDLVGTWQIQSMCVENPEQMFAVAGLPAECSDLFGGVDYRPAGEFVFREDGTGEANVTLMADIEMVLTDACVRAMGGSGVSPAVCDAMESSFSGSAEFQGAACESGANSCVCLVTSEEMTIASGGAYRVQGDLILEDSGPGSPFCVSGNTLTVQGEHSGVVMVMTMTRQ